MSNGEDYRSLSWHASQIEIWTIWTLCGLQDDKESTLARYKYSEPSTECQRQAYDEYKKIRSKFEAERFNFNSYNQCVANC